MPAESPVIFQHTHGTPFLHLDLVQLVIQLLWLDDSFHDRQPLVQALLFARDRNWRRPLLLIAWKHPVIRSFFDLHFYLHMRYGSLLDAPIRDQQHKTLLVHGFWLVLTPDVMRKSTRDSLLCRNGFANIFPNIEVFGIPGNQWLILPAPCLSMQEHEVLTLGVRDMSIGPWMTEWHKVGLCPTKLTLCIDTPITQKDLENILPLSSVTSITIIHRTNIAHKQWTKLATVFPKLQHLSLLGPGSSLLNKLQHVPESLECIELDAQTGIPGAPHGTIHMWRLIPALRQGFRVGPSGHRSPEVVLIGGEHEPAGWSDAVKIANKTGVRLSRRVVHGSAIELHCWT